MQLDHIVPLARGGTHEPRNVQVSHARCNNRKYSTGPGQPRLLD
jgi:5-methylcytosine-specific restriction endonuclease McrA